jgi:hypothetical protein
LPAQNATRVDIGRCRIFKKKGPIVHKSTGL